MQKSWTGHLSSNQCKIIKIINEINNFMAVFSLVNYPLFCNLGRLYVQADPAICAPEYPLWITIKEGEISSFYKDCRQ